MLIELKVGMEKVIKQHLTKLLAERDILTILCTFAAIGIIRLIYDLCLLIKRKMFGEKYLSKYKQLRRSNPFDENCYQWLLRNVTRMENEMGGAGRIDFYRPPHANYAFHNYDALSNTLLNIRTPVIANLETTQILLERYIGALDNRTSKKLWELINPVIWLTRTVRLILLDIPLWILNSFGLISRDTENKIKYSSIISKLIGLITILGSLFSIISGWNTIVTFFRRIFG